MSIFKRLEKGVALDKLNKSDIVELLTSSIKTLSEKEALQLSDNPNLFWFEFNFDENENYTALYVELQYKGNRYKTIFQIAN